MVAVAVGILLLAGVVGLILHPVLSLRRLLRFTVALLAVVLIAKSLSILFVTPKASLVEWVPPCSRSWRRGDGISVQPDWSASC